MYSNIKSKQFRGFTLIELLVVIAIIGLLSTVIAAPINEARKKGRDAKKIADLRSINTAIQLYADDNAGEFPRDLTQIVPRYLANLPSNAASTAIARDKYMYVAYQDPSVTSPAGNTGGRVVGYHMVVKLESANQALTDDVDCGGITTALAGTAKPCIGAATAAVPYVCLGTCTAYQANYASGDAGNPQPTSNSTDVGGSIDSATSTCTSALTTCIYDLTN
jgi:prepilin-type N-terminal cleavage/methylation domain-containing protein